jgi:para-aminobenzoate synthetase component 1
MLVSESRSTAVEEIRLGVSFDELFGALRDRPGAFFLDSALGAGGLGAWSFIGFDPFLEFRAKERRVTLFEDGRTEVREGDPLEELGALMAKFRAPAARGIPFAGGAVGCLSYELCAQGDGIRRSRPDDEGIPDAAFGFYDGVMAFDHGEGRAFMAANPVHRRDAEAILRAMEGTVGEALGHRVDGGRLGEPSLPACGRSVVPESALCCSYTKDEYRAAVRRIKDYIAAGDVYQVNLTQRFDAPLSCHPYELYRSLRSRSPAPFAGYLNLGPLQVLSSSPERFLSVRGRRAETRPIKGTRPRGRNAEEDGRLREELLASEKDRAELLMIVDLERNDLGRVCEFGTVRVEELYRLESHPTVHHLVATVSGLLRPGSGAVDAIRAMFPGGSITGAPKIRAMQIIDEVEPCRRHFYTGAVGYLGFDGDGDLNVAIRTMFCRGKRAWYNVGGGIVWDSDPDAEHQECLDKGRAMRAALCEEGAGT